MFNYEITLKATRLKANIIGVVKVQYSINLKLGSQIDHSIMGLLMVRNMKHLLLNLLINSQSLKKEPSETTFLVENKNDLSLSPMFFALNSSKLEVGE